MECANNAIKVIMFMLWVSTLAFAQGGTISGSIRQRSTGLGIQMAYITVTEARTHMVAGSGVTDAVGGYSVALPETGDYTLRVAKFGYESILRSGVIALSAAVPDQQVDLSMDVEALMTAAPAAKPQVLSWKRVMARATSSRPWKSRPSSRSSASTTATPTPTRRRMGSKSIPRPSRPPGTISPGNTG